MPPLLAKRSIHRLTFMNLDLPGFKRVMRGFDPEEVEKAWAEMRQQVFDLTAAKKELELQVNSLREQNREWEHRVRSYEQIEKDLRDAMLSTQRIANQVEEEARRQSESILTEAKQEADTLVTQARQTAESKLAEVDRIMEERRTDIANLEVDYTKLQSLKVKLDNQLEHAIVHLQAVQEILSAAEDD